MSFDILEEYNNEENTRFVFLRHNQTGLEIAYHKHITKYEGFSFTFKTPVVNPFLGTSHAVEHCIYGGSRKYPFDMLDLRKYLSFSENNGYTSPIATNYNFKTNNPSDFMKMIPIYADYLFFPLLSENTFMKDVFRIEKDEDGFFLAGALYNEVKCNFKRSIRTGGSPYKIHELTLQKLRNYHKKYYRPDNCLFCYDGNMLSLDDLLKLIESTFMKDLCKSFNNPTASKTHITKDNDAIVETKIESLNHWFMNNSPKNYLSALSWYWEYGFSPLTPFNSKNDKYMAAINMECSLQNDIITRKFPEQKTEQVIIKEFFLVNNKKEYKKKLDIFHKEIMENQDIKIHDLAGPFNDYSEKDFDWNNIKKRIECRNMGIEACFDNCNGENCNGSLKILLSNQKKFYFSDLALCFWLVSYLDKKIRDSGYGYSVSLRLYPEIAEFRFINTSYIKKSICRAIDSIKELESFSQNDLMISHIAAFNYLSGNDYHPVIFMENLDIINFSADFFSVTPQDMKDSLLRLQNRLLHGIIEN